MGRSLVNAVVSGVMDFDAAPGRPHGNVFQCDSEEVEMQLIPLPRSLARSKPWWIDTLLPEAPASQIVRVFQLGPAPDPDEKLLRGIPKGLLESASSLDQQEATDVPAGASSTDETEAEQNNVIILPFATEAQDPLPSIQPKTRALCNFISLSENLAKVPMPPSLARGSADSKQNIEFTCWKTRAQGAPAEIRGLDPSAFPMRGFQRARLRERPAKPVRNLALCRRCSGSGFTGAAIVLPQSGLDQARKALPLGAWAAPVAAAHATGEAGVQAEPFFITPPMRLPRCGFTVKQRYTPPLFVVPKTATFASKVS